MEYIIKRIEELYEDDKLVSTSFAVCVTDGELGATKHVVVPDIEAYLLDKEGVIKTLATEVAAGMTLPELPLEKNVVMLENITITESDVAEKREEIEAETMV